MSGIMYQNKPYGTGGGGGGGASALSQLTDVALSSPADGQVLKYDGTNYVWKNADDTIVVANPSASAAAQLTKLQVGETVYSISGGGGSSITYGYDNPSDAASDGDVYYLLDSNDKKKGLFLYMNNSWTLIEGTPYFELKLYDHGTESVSWTVSGGTKNANNISLNVGGGTYTNYAVIDNPIDLTDYNTLHVECRYRSRDYNLDLDISNYTGSKYISFTYLTDTSHNEAAIGITDTKTGAATIRIDSRNGDTAEQLLYYMSLY